MTLKGKVRQAAARDIHIHGRADWHFLALWLLAVLQLVVSLAR